MKITELFEPGKDWEWSFNGSEEAVAVFHVGNIPYRFVAYTDPNTPGVWEVEFKNADRRLGRSTKFGLTGTGNAAEVMSVIADIMRDFLQRYHGNVTSLVFTADEASRQALYARMAKRLLPTWNLTQQGKAFTLSAPSETTNEDNRITLSNPGREAAVAWIKKVYDMYPTVWQGNHVMMWGEGENQQMAMFELVPSFSKRGAVDVKWFQAHPLRQGVGSRAMQELQRLAKEDGIALTLFPWDKGQVSQAKLTKFYKGHGFTPTAKGSKNMQWEPK